MCRAPSYQARTREMKRVGTALRENDLSGRGKTIGVRCAPAPIADTRREI